MFESGAFTIVNVVGEMIMTTLYNVNKDKSHDNIGVARAFEIKDNLGETSRSLYAMLADSSNVWIEVSNKIGISPATRFVIYSVVKHHRSSRDPKWVAILPRWMEDEFEYISELIPDIYHDDTNEEKMQEQFRKCVKLLTY